MLKKLEQFDALLRDHPLDPNALVTAPERTATQERIESRSPLKVADVEARLEDSVAGIEFKEIPLLDFVRVISSLSTIPITIRPEVFDRGRSGPIPKWPSGKPKRPLAKR